MTCMTSDAVHFSSFLGLFDPLLKQCAKGNQKLPILGSLDLEDLNHQLEHDLAMVPIIILVSSLDPIFTESKDLLLM